MHESIRNENIFLFKWNPKIRAIQILVSMAHAWQMENPFAVIVKRKFCNSQEVTLTKAKLY